MSVMSMSDGWPEIGSMRLAASTDFATISSGDIKAKVRKV